MQTAPPFQMIAKPVGPLCNLACSYCFYLEKEQQLEPLVNAEGSWIMPDEVLKSYIQQKLTSSNSVEEYFLWQGGEPTLLGVEYFRRIVALQQKYAAQKRVKNALQTNGILLDDTWCSFLKEHEFLVGISLDGPRELHNKYRVDKQGQPSFDQVMETITRLKSHQVTFNTLTTVHSGNSAYPLEIYQFLKSLDPAVMQFIPVVERTALRPPADFGSQDLVDSTEKSDRTNIPQDHSRTALNEWSVNSVAYGRFLNAIFDVWVQQDVGQQFIQNFDVSLEAWCGRPSSICVFSETCGRDPVIEHNGDLYACDHYVYPEYKFANILKTTLLEFIQSPEQRHFGSAKKDTLPQTCLACNFRFACHGGCPKHRFIKAPDGEPGLNYLCAGYQEYFKHIEPYMQFMADELRHQRPPTNVMAWAKDIVNRANW